MFLYLLKNKFMIRLFIALLMEEMNFCIHHQRITLLKFGMKNNVISNCFFIDSVYYMITIKLNKIYLI